MDAQIAETKIPGRIARTFRESNSYLLLLYRRKCTAQIQEACELAIAK